MDPSPAAGNHPLLSLLLWLLHDSESLENTPNSFSALKAVNLCNSCKVSAGSFLLVPESTTLHPSPSQMFVLNYFARVGYLLCLHCSWGLQMRSVEEFISPVSDTQGKSRMFNKNKYFFKDALWMCCCNTMYKAKVSIKRDALKNMKYEYFKAASLKELFAFYSLFFTFTEVEVEIVTRDYNYWFNPVLIFWCFVQVFQ